MLELADYLQEIQLFDELERILNEMIMNSDNKSDNN